MTDAGNSSCGYDYTALERDIISLKSQYPFIETGMAGKSIMGRDLHYIRLGYGPVRVFYNASHHANEWITSMLLMKFASRFLDAYVRGLKLKCYDISNIYEKCSIYMAPMVNPDGVDYVIKGGMSQWKANIRGVDLNLNYPAGWEKAKKYEHRFNATSPSPSRHAGEAPLSEPEALAMAAFTRRHDFRMVIAYHTQGREIYWKYLDCNPSKSSVIASLFSAASGYQLAETVPEDSYAGFKDWFIHEFNRPGFTIEAGYGQNPLPLSQFDEIYDENEEIMLIAPLLAIGLI